MSCHRPGEADNQGDRDNDKARQGVPSPVGAENRWAEHGVVASQRGIGTEIFRYPEIAKREPPLARRPRLSPRECRHLIQHAHANKSEPALAKNPIPRLSPPEHPPNHT